MLKALKRRLFLRAPIELWGVSFGDISKFASGLGVVSDKGSVVAGEPGKPTEVFEVLWLWPLKDGDNLVRVHSDLARFEDMTEELYPGDLKLALL